MSWLPLPFFAFLLQSNHAIGEALSNGGLNPEPSTYTGITGIFAQFFLALITLIGNFIHNYGIAIILTAIVVRMLLLPLTRIQITGMKSMQMLQPVMKEIQRFYPNKQDQSAKTMELYSKYKINPLSGCLPMLIQLPILFGVYRALYDPYFAGKNFLGIQLLFPVNVTSGRSFGHGPELADLIDVTVAKLDLWHTLVHIPASVPLIGDSYWYLPGLALVVLYVISSLLMQRLMRKVNAPDPEFAEEFKEEMKHRGGEEDNKPDMANQMQKQMGFMNFIIIIFAFIFSAGALIYFIVQNSLMMLEYTWIPKLYPQAPLDPKEMKAFIRQAPPPTGPQPKGGKPEHNSKKPEKPADIKPTTQETNAGNGSGEPEEAVPAKLSRPRKKRRKR